MHVEQSCPVSSPRPSSSHIWWNLGFALVASLLSLIFILSSWPLGILGEWVWNRSTNPPTNLSNWILLLITTIVFLATFALGNRLLRSRGGFREIPLLLGLLAAAMPLQAAIFLAPNPGYGLQRWPPALFLESSSGYFTVARRINDSSDFLSNYSAWVREADVFHLGTHPPGLILMNRFFLDRFQANPTLARTVIESSPRQIREGLTIQTAHDGLSFPEQATLIAVAALTWWASMLTALPVYILTRLGGYPSQAWLAATLWVASPAAILFLPIADSMYPLLAVTITLALVVAQQLRLGLFALLAGALLWIGMMLSAAFLAVAFLATLAMALAAWRDRKWLQPIWLLICFAAGFALPCEWIAARFDLNLLDVWRANLQKHAAFYEVMPRSYAKWLLVGPVEFAIVAGPPAAILALRYIPALRRLSSPVDCTILSALTTVLLLDLSGRNLGEVGRLWLFLTPFVSIAAARKWTPSGAPRTPPAYTLALLALQVLLAAICYGWIEPLLPVALQ